MKSKYLMLTLLSALVISGCRNDNDTSSTSSSTNNTNSSSVSSVPSSLSSNLSTGSVNSSGSTSNSSSVISSSSVTSSSSSSQVYIPTIAEAVSHISDNYSIYYSIETNGVKYDFKNALERMSMSGAEGHLAYYSEYSEYGYYITEDTGYTIYLNGYGKPIYNTVSELEAEEVDLFETLIDLNTNFSNAEWDFDNHNNGVYEYFTDDPYVVATSSFLTDYTNKENPVSYVKATVKKSGSKYKISGFTTFDADGYTLTEAEIKRIGGSMPLNEVPVLDDNLDSALSTKWMVATQYGNHITGYMGAFEIKNNGELIVYDVNQDTGVYVKTGETYTYAEPNGMGYYIFEKADSEDNVMLKVSNGEVLFYTYDAETDTVGVDIAVEYYTAWFQLGANYLGYYMEEVTSGDVNYEIVTGLKASKGYYLYSTYVDANGEEVIDKMVIIVQYLNKEVLVENYFEGDTAIYNGFALSGYAFGNLALAAYYSPESVTLLMSVARSLPIEFADFDSAKYPEVTEGQSALDYIVSYFESEGYTAVNKETADPDFVVNESLDEETNEMVGTNFYEDINEIVTNYTEVTNDEGTVLFSATDFYVFYKANPDEDPEEDGDEYIYAGLMVCDTNMNAYLGGYDNVYVVGYGFFAITGAIYELACNWYNLQPLA